MLMFLSSLLVVLAVLAGHSGLADVLGVHAGILGTLASLGDLVGVLNVNAGILCTPVVHDDLLGAFIVPVNLLGILGVQARSNIQVRQDGVSDGHFGGFGKAGR